MKTILNDTRTIESIQFSLLDSPDFAVGKFGVTKIEAYPEGGMSCDIPWINVFKGDEIIKRICCHQLAAINYAKN